MLQHSGSRMKSLRQTLFTKALLIFSRSLWKKELDFPLKSTSGSYKILLLGGTLIFFQFWSCESWPKISLAVSTIWGFQTSLTHSQRGENIIKHYLSHSLPNALTCVIWTNQASLNHHVIFFSKELHRVNRRKNMTNAIQIIQIISN